MFGWIRPHMNCQHLNCQLNESVKRLGCMRGTKLYSENEKPSQPKLQLLNWDFKKRGTRCGPIENRASIRKKKVDNHQNNSISLSFLYIQISSWIHISLEKHMMVGLFCSFDVLEDLLCFLRSKDSRNIKISNHSCELLICSVPEISEQQILNNGKR